MKKIFTLRDNRTPSHVVLSTRKQAIILEHVATDCAFGIQSPAKNLYVFYANKDVKIHLSILDKRKNYADFLRFSLLFF